LSKEARNIAVLVQVLRIKSMMLGCLLLACISGVGIATRPHTEIDDAKFLKVDDFNGTPSDNDGRPSDVPEKKKKIGIYGGAFNPPTNAHLQLAAEIVHSGAVDEVWMVPSGPRPDKPDMLPAMQRFEMCQIAVSTMFAADFPVKVSKHEAEKDQPTPTYASLKWLTENFDNHEFSFVIGSDWLRPGMNIRGWVNGPQLLEEFEFLVVKRPGYDTVEDLSSYGPRFRWIEFPRDFTLVESSASSTEVRKRAKHDWANGITDLRDIEGLVPPGVYNFIVQNGLYK